MKNQSLLFWVLLLLVIDTKSRHVANRFKPEMRAIALIGGSLLSIKLIDSDTAKYSICAASLLNKYVLSRILEA